MISPKAGTPAHRLLLIAKRPDEIGPTEAERAAVDAALALLRGLP